MNPRSLKTLGTGLLALGILTLPSCLFGSQTRTTFRGQYINQSTYNQVQPGASEDDVYSRFGEPTTKSAQGDTDVWRYHYTEATTKKGAVLFLFATSTETEHEGTVTVEFVDAVVTRVTRG